LLAEDHFSAIAGEYAEYRPSYPAALSSFLARVAPSRGLAWDCATGSGQAAVLLAREFAHVVATDMSPQQLAHAQPARNIEYRQGRESESGLAPASCDLVTAAQAAHWLDLASFYAEADRVLKPGGVVAIWGYGVIRISAAIDPIVQWFERERVGRHWPGGREHTNAQYRTLAFPYARIEAPQFVMEHRWPRDRFLGYLRTWSAVERCTRAEGRDPVPEIEARLAPLWSDREVRLIQWPIHLFAGHRP
jgi:SAM-dependent methyltransferase